MTDLFQGIFENAVVGLYRTTPDGRVLMANSSFVQMLGFASFEELTQFNLENGADVTGYPRDTFKQKLEAAGQVVGFQSTWMRSDGSKLYARESARVIQDKEGNALYYEGTVEDITEQVLAQEALKASESKFRSIIDAIPVGMYTFRLEADGRLVFTGANPAAASIGDLGSKQYEGQILEEIFPALIERGAPDKYREVALTGQTWRTEQIIYQEEQIQAVFEVYAFRTAPNEIALAFLDVTDRAQAQQAERRRVEQLDALRQVSQDISLLHDLDVLLCQITERALQLLGRPSGGISFYRPERQVLEWMVNVGESLAPIGFTLEEGEGVGGAVWATGEPVIINDYLDWPGHSLQREDFSASVLGAPIQWGEEFLGVLTVADRSKRPFGAEDATLLAYFAVQAAIAIQNVQLYEQAQQEIVERRRAEAEITRLQHLLQNITDSMPSVLITLDPAGRVLTWNPAATDLTGRVAEEIKGQLLWQCCPELDRYRDLFEQVLEQGQVAHRHREPLASDTGTIYREVSVYPLESNEVEGAVLRIDDVTRRVQLEEMMLQSAKMASVGGLAAGVAHEINNPLGAMMQSAQMLQIVLDTERPRTQERLGRYGIDPQHLGRYLAERGLVEYLEGIRSAGGRAAKIVTDLLSFSRKTSSEVAPRELDALVKQALDLAAADYDLKKQYDFRDIDTVLELAGDLPKVMCDGQQIQQVMLNLVRNAAQAMSEKKERYPKYQPKLVVRTSYKRGWVQVEVEDNGPGIPESIRPWLFEPFFTTKEVGQGTGLGLWLCWSIVVERHRGRIRAESVMEFEDDEGPGTLAGNRMVVELPVQLVE